MSPLEQIVPYNTFILKEVTSMIFLLYIIVSIHDAPEGRYSYQVSLRRPFHFCGGSIVNERWILTAAHCLQGKDVKTVQVVVGTTSRSQGSGTAYQAENLIYHQGYSTEKFQNDIGLVRVDRDIKFSEKVQPIELARKDTIAVGESVVLSGWGRVASKRTLPTTFYSTTVSFNSSCVNLQGDTKPEKLQNILLKVYDLEKCKKKMSHPVIETQICTFTKKSEGFCKGDSGGPLVNKIGVQVGIVAYARGCGAGNPDVYTRVSSFSDWINKQIGRHCTQK
ncbi:hypothetical protein TSAR_008366 [Trichomalopsis sarcophagae]|uniref:Peptidase S1 domain-containing protein n=1 Tax=Trichomalopsis sarcophagae TaxID=543379 RepID=A0A232F6T0_9HYME|nr:hypothetical protein TSAR_008366 [Trichomalopsis sarcophagae]